jgi:hypothetical protein
MIPTGQGWHDSCTCPSAGGTSNLLRISYVYNFRDEGAG